METKTAIRYHVSIEGQHSWFADDGWSGYSDRFKAKICGQLNGEEIYGYQQALEHIEELRAKVYNGELHLKDAKFQIEIHTIVVTTIPIKTN